MAVKLAAYKRDLMLNGLNNQDNNSKEMGQQILDSLKYETLKKNKTIFKNMDYSQFVQDPLNNKEYITADEREQLRF